MGLATPELPDALYSMDLASTLRLSQQTPSVLGPGSSSTLFTSGPDDAENFRAIERHFLACLQSGDDESAHSCLNRLTERFGSQNAQIMGLRGLYGEATGEDAASLEKRLREYEKIVSEDPVNVVCHWWWWWRLPYSLERVKR